jgi:glutamate-1-semialdehyde 2,1-aminomutase
MKRVYRELDETWDRRAAELNRRLAERRLPVRIGHLSSIWTVCYPTASRYNWMFQYYLKAHGLALSWVGTGRLIFSLNFTEEQFQAVADRFVAAAEAMQRDGWWEPGALATDRAIKRRILREMASHLFGFPGRGRKERLAGPQPLDAAL